MSKYVDKQAPDYEWLIEHNKTLLDIGESYKKDAEDAYALLAEKDVEIQRLKDLMSGRKGIEELYTARESLYEARREIERLRQSNWELRDDLSAANAECEMLLDVKRHLDTENQRLRAAHEKIISDVPYSDTTAKDAVAISRAALSHQTEQPDTLTPEFKFPRQPGSKGGWTIPPDYIERVSTDIAQHHGDDVAWEQIESVLLAVERMFQPAPKGEQPGPGDPWEVSSAFLQQTKGRG